MLYKQSRENFREVFFKAWQKFKEHKPIEPLEAEIIEVIKHHPEYHSFIENPDNIDKDFIAGITDHNPFMHLSMHLALREQKITNRPPGISQLYDNLVTKNQGDIHAVEHQMIEVLADCLRKGMQSGQPVSDPDYLSALQK